MLNSYMTRIVFSLQRGRPAAAASCGTPGEWKFCSVLFEILGSCNVLVYSFWRAPHLPLQRRTRGSCSANTRPPRDYCPLICHPLHFARSRETLDFVQKSRFSEELVMSCITPHLPAGQDLGRAEGVWEQGGDPSADCESEGGIGDCACTPQVSEHQGGSDALPSSQSLVKVPLAGVYVSYTLLLVSRDGLCCIRNY